MSQEIDLEEVHDTLVSVALEAGKMIASANPTDISTDTKLNSADIVTETDKAVEQLVSARLKDAYPDFNFMGEETFKPGDKVGSSPTFIIDPIDGTTNFVHSFPNACISAGFAVENKPVIGIVYNPFSDVMFSAIKDKGAWMVKHATLLGASPTAAAADAAINGARALPTWRTHPSNQHASPLPLSRHPPPLRTLQEALVAIEWGSAREDANFELKLQTFERLARDRSNGGVMTQGLRSLGSAALNLCHVAAGQLDAYWEGGCWAWDVCAGWCVLQEAGGLMVSGNPNEVAELEGRAYLAVRAASGGKETQMRFIDQFWGVIGEGNRLEY